MFVHELNAEKENQRVLIASLIKKYVNTPNSMLTLSADNFVFENKFPKTKIVSCELDVLTYRKGIKRKPKHVTFKNKDIFEEKPYYEVIWLDLCISLSVKTINQIISYLQDSKATIVGITLQAQREHLVKDLSFYGASNMQEFREKTFPNLIYALTGYKLIKLSKYRTDVNMIMYIFKNK
jgi:hypothetical protein